MIDAPFGPRPLPARIRDLGGGNVCWAGFVGDIGPWRGVKLTQCLGRKQRDTTQEAASLVFVQDIDGGFGSFPSTARVSVWCSMASIMFKRSWLCWWLDKISGAKVWWELVARMCSPLTAILGTATLSREVRKEDPLDALSSFWDFLVEPALRLVLRLVLRREDVERDGEGSLVLVVGPACGAGVPGTGLSTAVVYLDKCFPVSVVPRGDGAYSESSRCSEAAGSAIGPAAGAGAGALRRGLTASAAWSTKFISWS